MKSWVFIKVKVREAITSVYAERVLDCFPAPSQMCLNLEVFQRTMRG